MLTESANFKDALLKSKIEKIQSIVSSESALQKLEEPQDTTAGGGVLGFIQDLVKKTGGLYFFLLEVLGPAYTLPAANAMIKNTLRSFDTEKIILNVGSGPYGFYNRADIINLDLFGFKGVDITADATQLPIKTDSIDLVINSAMLEHVLQPALVVDEMHRVLKPGGQALVFLPFMQPFHAAPHDYFRWTRRGGHQLLSQFETCESVLIHGPCSTMGWVFIEWFSMLFSFGSSQLKDLFFLIFMLLTFPFKYLDLIFIHLPKAENLANGYYFLCTKKSTV